jgi:hypothetical protein
MPQKVATTTPKSHTYSDMKYLFQIGALKDKLRETDSLLREHERRQSDSLLSVDSLAKWLQGQKSPEEARAALLKRSDDLEKSDETYVALMSARYSMLNAEAASLR